MYTSGLSGGSWPVMGLATYNFPEIDTLLADWHLAANPIPASTTKETSSYRASIKVLLEQVYEKFAAGFPVGYGDFLGRAYAYQVTVRLMLVIVMKD